MADALICYRINDIEFQLEKAETAKKSQVTDLYWPID